MKEISSSVVLAENDDIESSMKESSKKQLSLPIYKRTHKDGISTHTVLEFRLESGIFVKKPWDSQSRTDRKSVSDSSHCARYFWLCHLGFAF